MTTAQLLEQVKNGKVSIEDAQKLLAQQGQKPISFKVSEKGAVSVYGLNARFPVTLYAEQWDRLLNAADDLRAFIKANDKALSKK